MRKCLLLAVLLLAGLQVGAEKRSARDASLAFDGRHVVSFSPLGGIAAFGEFNPAFGLDYEYVVSQEAGIGIRLPLAFGWTGPDQDDFFYGNSYNHTSVYAAPGVRFHAPIRRGAGEFCTGPAVIIGNMHFSPNNDYNSGSGTFNQPFDYQMFGLMADNSINFYRNHFLFGFDARVGYMMEAHDDTRFFIHFGMHFGGKF